MRPLFPQSESEPFLGWTVWASQPRVYLRRHVIGGKNLSKDAIDKASDAIKHTVDDVKDSVHEGQHRSAADIEKAKREALGDELTPSEKVGSALNEAKHRTQAEIDAAKRNIRDHG